MIDLSNPNGTVFGLMPQEWQGAFDNYRETVAKGEVFIGGCWNPDPFQRICAAYAYRAARSTACRT